MPISSQENNGRSEKEGVSKGDQWRHHSGSLPRNSAAVEPSPWGRPGQPASERIFCHCIPVPLPFNPYSSQRRDRFDPSTVLSAPTPVETHSKTILATLHLTQRARFPK